jgi:hypothetical protein
MSSSYQERGNKQEYSLHIVDPLGTNEKMRTKPIKNIYVIGPPQSINFLIPQEYSDIILYDSGLEDLRRILIIGSNDLLPYLERGETWFGDGTFKVVPRLFF